MSGSALSGERRSLSSRIRIDGLAVRISSALEAYELVRQPLGGGGVDRLVERDDAAEGAQRVGRKRALVGLQRAGAERDAAGVVVLDDDARGLGEIAHEAARGVEVEQVVERQLLAVMLLDHRQHVHPRADLVVVGGPLVGVLAVGQVDDLLVGAHVQRREVLGCLGEPARDGGVVAGGVGERLGGERLARRHRQQSVGHAQLVEDRVVGLGARDHRRERMVLRGRTDHRRAADVDVLDDVGGWQAARDAALERIEVHAHQVDVLDAVLCHGIDVRLFVAHGEQAGVEARVQRLDAAVHDLGKAGEGLDRADVEVGRGELRRGAACRHELDAKPGEAAREVEDPALVGDREQRAADLHRAGCGQSRGALVVGLDGDLARITAARLTR